MRTSITSIRWRRWRSTEATASQYASASTPLYRVAENIGFASVVETELKLVEVQREILLADMMIRADDATLQQCPETFDVIGMYFAAHVLKRFVINGLVAKCLMQFLIARTFVGRDQVNFFRNHLTHKLRHRFSRSVNNNLADDVSLASDCADDRDLADRPAPANLKPLAQRTVDVLSADVGFIDLDNAHELAEVWIFHSRPQSHAHIPSGLIRTASDPAMDLQGADSLTRSDHEMQHAKPGEQWIFGFLKNGSSLERKPIRRAVILAALLALPMPRTRLARIYMVVSTTHALNAIGPATCEEVRPASLFGRKHPVEVGQSHLFNEATFGFSAHVENYR